MTRPAAFSTAVPDGDNDLVPFIDTSDTSGHASGTEKIASPQDVVESTTAALVPVEWTADNRLTRTIGASGRSIEESAVTVSDAGALSGITTISASGAVTVGSIVTSGTVDGVDVSAHAAATGAHGVTGNIVGTGGTQTLTDKTLTTPTIGSFVNATHDHADAAGGGVLDSDNIAYDNTVSGLTATNVKDAIDELEAGGGGSDDQTAAEVPFTPAGTIAATDVQAAIEEASGDMTTHAALTAAHGAAGAVVGTTNSQTLTNKTLTTPVIGDFTSANHDHDDAFGGGTLSATVLTSGTVATARLGSGVADGTTFLRGDQTWATPAGGGDVSGPGIAVTDNALVRWDTASGTDVQNSNVTLLDAGAFDMLGTTTPTAPAAGRVQLYAKADGHVYCQDESSNEFDLTEGAGSGDVVGPASATDEVFARFDGTTGKLIQDGVVAATNAGAVTGVTTLNASGAVTVGSLVTSGAVDGVDVSAHAASAAEHGAAGAVVGTTNSQTLTNKTLTTPTITSILTGFGTLTLPTATDTLVGRATTDTLTNKTLTTPTIGDYTNAAHGHTNGASGGVLNASAIAYSNSSSGLTAANVQAAIDEIIEPTISTRHARSWGFLAVAGAANMIPVAGGSVTAMGTSSSISTGFATDEGWTRQVLTTASATNTTAGVRQSSGHVELAPGADNGATPIVFRGSFAAADANSGCRMFLGLRVATADPGSNEPSAFLNCIGLAADSDMSELVVMHNDGSGVCTEITLNGGSGFPCNTNAVDKYEFEFAFTGEGGVQTVHYLARNRSDGVAVSGDITTNLPASGVLLNVYCFRNTAANSAVAVVHIGDLTGGTFSGVTLPLKA